MHAVGRDQHKLHERAEAGQKFWHEEEPTADRQLQQQVQKQSLGQRIEASLPPAVQQQQQAAQQAAGQPSPMMVDGSAADTASLQAQAGQQVTMHQAACSRLLPQLCTTLKP